MTLFRRSSNSPRYLAPAISAPMSSAISMRSCSEDGTSPVIMRCARPALAPEQTLYAFPALLCSQSQVQHFCQIYAYSSELKLLMRCAKSACTAAANSLCDAAAILAASLTCISQHTLCTHSCLWRSILCAHLFATEDGNSCAIPSAPSRDQLFKNACEQTELHSLFHCGKLKLTCKPTQVLQSSTYPTRRTERTAKAPPAQYATGRTLRDGGLADAGLADEHGVVLGAARQDLDARRISSSRPITGSSLPSRAAAVRSRAYLASASYLPSGSCERAMHS